jgi:hypothetical protein
MVRRRAEAAERVALATTRLRDQALSADDEDALYHTPAAAIEAALSEVAPIVERDMPVWERRVKVCTMRNLGKSLPRIWAGTCQRSSQGPQTAFLSSTRT